MHSHDDIRPGHYLLANGCGLFWERIEYRGNTSGTASLYYGSPSDNNAPNDKVHVQLASVAGLPGLAWDYDFVGSTYSGAFPYEVDKQGNDSTIAKWQHTAKDNDWANYDSIISVQPGWNQREAQNNNCIVRVMQGLGTSYSQIRFCRWGLGRDYDEQFYVPGYQFSVAKP